MNSQPSMMIAVDQAVMLKLLDEMAALRRAVERVNMTPKSEWITISECAELLGRTPKTIREWVREGKIESRRQGTVLMVKAA
ncbi:helix-turn-helix domain-containing protein [Rhodobacter sp. 24-YEA-8]|uniref:helix-turn-helix domain-containing protein n=1 Tax=Rhodobacter sp. 24-YEA-8 TaxID=1884310 RepID=UPI00089BD85B|nr:helix-turn-helix domain-containing protein [Rhodobacter sp. 24-YEA-8]SEB77721.1 DNA binding domain-containing protein, excisionase family [Rhodobacter sp. 24-YEA-8]